MNGECRSESMKEELPGKQTSTAVTFATNFHFRKLLFLFF